MSSCNKVHLSNDYADICELKFRSNSKVKAMIKNNDT